MGKIYNLVRNMIIAKLQSAFPVVMYGIEGSIELGVGSLKLGCWFDRYALSCLPQVITEDFNSI